jgi:hypothetical protein
MKFCFYGNIAKALKGEPAGGGEQQLALIASSLVKLGQKVVVIDFVNEVDEDIDGVEISSLKKYNNTRFYYFAFYKLLKDVNADVYYARIRSSIHLIPLIVSKQNNAKLVYHLASDLDSLGFRERWKGFYSGLPIVKKGIHLIHSELFFSLLLKGSSAIIVQNEEQFTNLKSKGFKKIIIINNLFCFEFKNSFKRAKRKYDYFIYIGSMDSRKGVKELETIIEANNQQHFVLIGRARDEEAKAFIGKMKVRNNVQVLGQLNHNDVINYLVNASALINTSRNEGFSNAFIEAWSLGIPVYSLNSNPSRVLDRFNLGKSFGGNINKMIEGLKLFRKTDYYSEDIINYVKMNHDCMNNTSKILANI